MYSLIERYEAHQRDGEPLFLWRVRDIGVVFNVTPSTARRWLKSGWLSRYSYKVEGRYVIERDNLIAALKTRFIEFPVGYSAEQAARNSFARCKIS